MADQNAARTGSAQRPIPVSTAETRPFWDAMQVGRVRLPRCNACNRLLYPPPPCCPCCHARNLAWTDVSGQGRIAAWTIVHLATIPGIAPPFTLLEVELAEQTGLMVSALLDPASMGPLEIGAAVEMTFAGTTQASTTFPQFRIRGSD